MHAGIALLVVFDTGQRLPFAARLCMHAGVADKLAVGSARHKQAQVAIIMGSDSDLPLMAPAAQVHRLSHTFSLASLSVSIHTVHSNCVVCASAMSAAAMQSH